jgi:hypothetical protein
MSNAPQCPRAVFRRARRDPEHGRELLERVGDRIGVTFQIGVGDLGHYVELGLKQPLACGQLLAGRRDPGPQSLTSHVHAQRVLTTGGNQYPYIAELGCELGQTSEPILTSQLACLTHGLQSEEERPDSGQGRDYAGVHGPQVRREPIAPLRCPGWRISRTAPRTAPFRKSRLFRTPDLWRNAGSR